MATCIVKVREMISPYMEIKRGYRIVVASPNQAGHKAFSNEPAPSFLKPYLITEFGDFYNQKDITDSWARIVAELRGMGFDKINVL